MQARLRFPSTVFVIERSVYAAIAAAVVVALASCSSARQAAQPSPAATTPILVSQPIPAPAPRAIQPAKAAEVWWASTLTLLGAVAATIASASIALWQRVRRRSAEVVAHNLGRIVKATKEFGLIKDDRDARQAAKRWVGAEAHRDLKRALAADASGA